MIATNGELSGLFMVAFDGDKQKAFQIIGKVRTKRQDNFVLRDLHAPDWEPCIVYEANTLLRAIDSGTASIHFSEEGCRKHFKHYARKEDE